MATRPIEQNEFSLSPDAPIFQWVQRHDKASDFDPEGGSVTPVEVTHLKNPSPALEPQSQNHYQPVRTLEEIGAQSQDHGPLESYITLPRTEELELDAEDTRVGMLTRLRMGALGLRMNTLDRGVLSALDGLGRFGRRAARDVNPIEQNDSGEVRLRERTKVILGAVALAGVVYASERLGLVHQAQHLVHEAYNDVQGLAQASHEHSHTAKAIHNEATHQTINHTQHAANHSQNIKHQTTHTQHQIHKKESKVDYHFNAYRGDSATAEIQRYGAEKGKPISAEQAFRIYQNLKAHIGNHLFHRQYIMVDGQVGLPVGHNSWVPKAATALSKIFR